MKINKPVTLSVLAKRLSVSTTTVSKALRGKSGISLEMVERVRLLAGELGYRPNFAARLLKTKSTETIGVMINGDIVNPWYSQLVSRIEAALSAANLDMLLALGKNNPERERRNLQNLSDGRVGGLIIGAVCMNSNLRAIWEMIDRGLPLVAFNCIEQLPISYVAIDQRSGARLATEHLIARGHRRILYLGCPLSEPAGEGLWVRRDGFMEAMLAHNLPITRDSILYHENNRRIDGYEKIKALLEVSGNRLPTAIFCHNDNMALGAMMALQQAGVKIPDDISLIGFDNIEESSLCLPLLTTVGGVMNELASELVATMQGLIANSAADKPVQKLIQPKLIERESVRSI